MTAYDDAAPPAVLLRVIDEYLRRYHRHEVQIDAQLPETPALIVSNHGFGGILDLNVLALARTLDRIGDPRQTTFLVHQVAWTLGVGGLIEPLGCVPGSAAAVDEAFAAGRHVAVFPGGDVEAAKPTRERNRIKFAGRSGFARVAIDKGVPVVPVVTAGAGESLLVLSDGQRLARALRLPQLLRVKALPVSLTFPWGLNLGIAGMLPYAPLPTKLVTAVVPAMTPADGESAEAFATRVESAMQDRLTELTADRRPVVG
ncbi:glycerol acyltransferase [Nocardioides immobilis]|uniref:Glycerol acyltransferase n=1 Tax=Nocardioides immobilis TaxID=2049295 RepID=A0A417XT12_9ACTN|nr:1-acyl-sn-glycerol-3-phosphate acyltransferase [Nocardioides immobilis]RHW23381.1 glycerol acyltransferase [Nocardioides immobilis]